MEEKPVTQCPCCGYNGPPCPSVMSQCIYDYQTSAGNLKIFCENGCFLGEITQDETTISPLGDAESVISWFQEHGVCHTLVPGMRQIMRGCKTKEPVERMRRIYSMTTMSGACLELNFGKNRLHGRFIARTGGQWETISDSDPGSVVDWFSVKLGTHRFKESILSAIMDARRDEVASNFIEGNR